MSAPSRAAWPCKHVLDVQACALSSYGTTTDRALADHNSHQLPNKMPQAPVPVPADSSSACLTCPAPGVKGGLAVFMCHSLPEGQLWHTQLAHYAAALVLPGARQVGAEAVQAQQQQVQVADAHGALPALAAGWQ